MKPGIVIAALAAALITGSTVGSQAIPAAPLSKSIQQNSSSLVETGQISWVPRLSGSSACRRLPGLPGSWPLPGIYRRAGLYRGYRGVGYYGYRGYRRARGLRIQRLPRLPLGRRCPVSQSRLLVVKLCVSVGEA